MSYRHKWAALAFVLLALRGAPSRADVSPENRAAAQALFDEGRLLVKANRVAEACPKFEESQRLDPGVGTQLNLADCYERTGRTASAWTLYIDVASAARQAGQDERASHAAARVAALKDKLSHLVIVVPKESRIPGLTVERGSLLVGDAQWGAAMPVDPGSHTVKVSAPGKAPWQTTIVLAADGSTKTITVPLLKDGAPSESVPAGAPAPALEVDTKGVSGSQKTLAYAVGGLGVAGLAVGAIFGGIAISKKSDASCDANVCQGEEQRSTYEQAQKAGTVSTIAFALGGVALAGGAILYFTAPKSGATIGAGFGARASIAPGSVGISAGARW